MKRFSLYIFLVFLICIGCGGNPIIPTISPSAPSRPISPQPTENYSSSFTQNEIETLSSLELVDNYPLYTMHFVGDHNQSSVMLNNQISPANHQLDWACTLFAALSEDTDMLYGRNIDWNYSPALLLFTSPPEGYASVSVVDLAYFGFSAEDVDQLDQIPLTDRAALLDAAWWPFDGMNDQGLVIGMAAVPPGNMVSDPQKDTLDSLEIMRKILDEASNVDEALEIIQRYNIDMGGGPPLHYLIADRSGRAILIEFMAGEMLVIPNKEPWHLATNFLCSAVDESFQGNCWRFDTVMEQLRRSAGALQIGEGLTLLEEVSQTNTQWSVIYGITTGRIDIVVGQHYENIHTFWLNPIDD